MISHGFKIVTTAGIAVPLSTTSVPCTFITFFPRVVSGVPNTGQVRLGGPPLSGDGTAIPSGKGMPLSPGDAGVAWPSGAQSYDLNNIYIDADTNSDGTQYIYGTA